MKSMLELLITTARPTTGGIQGGHALPEMFFRQLHASRFAVLLMRLKNTSSTLNSPSVLSLYACCAKKAGTLPLCVANLNTFRRQGKPL
jgi:hypothetical protein